MDHCSWMLLHGGHGDGKDSERSHGSGLLHEEQDVTISSQLKQIYMLMNTDEDGYTTTVPPMLSPSSTFGSFSGGKHDENSSLMLTGSTATSSHQPLEIFSPQMPLSPMVYNENRDGLCFGNIDTVRNLDNLMTNQEPHRDQARCRNGHESSGAFRPYIRHLRPWKKPKPGACGQRAIKAAMSVLERMHMAQLAHWQSCPMMAASPPVIDNSDDSNQLQHVLSERKRREKINDSFKALRTVLPPGSKKDKASTLIGARDYVNALKIRVSELEENRMLVKSQLHDDNSGKQDDHSCEQIAVDITRAAATGQTSQEFRLKIVLGSGQNAMDAVVTILKGLKETGDVRLVAMDTSNRSNGLRPGKDFQM